MATFGEKLRELRTAADMTQAALADVSGVPVGTIRDYEQGKRDPLLSTAQKLAHALDHTVEVFDSVAPGVQGKVAPSASRGRPRKADDVPPPEPPPAAKKGKGRKKS